VVIDYTIFYKEKVRSPAEINGRWDVFISAFNESERVTAVFEAVQSTEKHWLIHPEYGFAAYELPSGDHIFPSQHLHEADFILEYTAAAGLNISGARICVDSTGFMRPQLMCLLKWLHEQGCDQFDVLYTDPVRYAEAERTQFTKGPVVEVRQVAGYEGQHVPDSGGNDLLLIGAGYDHELIRRVAEDKASARKTELFGLPSLSPEMYQESVLRASNAAEAMGGNEQDILFAPANDPFVTAQVIHEVVERERGRQRLANLYLSPLGTKAQTLGFALYYLTECRGSAASVIFPFARHYTRETTKGIAHIWKYTFEFPASTPVGSDHRANLTSGSS